MGSFILLLVFKISIEFFEHVLGSFHFLIKICNLAVLIKVEIESGLFEKFLVPDSVKFV